jgi:hypothetical protein
VELITAAAETSNDPEAGYRLPELGNCTGPKHQHDDGFLYLAHHVRGEDALCDRCALEFDLYVERSVITELTVIAAMAGSPS